jgi:hypothetical protein
MPATRTQIYLTTEQRDRIDEVTARDGITLAEVVRRALDSYLTSLAIDPGPALDATFGAEPAIDVPSRDEWAARG